jgi:low affinity Fe/Cu permease
MLLYIEAVMSNKKFEKFAQTLSEKAGNPITFQIAVLAIVVWALSGPFFKFDDTWQLIINTSTTIITFLMVFLIQNAQNRDSDALHIKLDELIRATEGAKEELMAVDKNNAEELKKLREKYSQLGSALPKQDTIHDS